MKNTSGDCFEPDFGLFAAPNRWSQVSSPYLMLGECKSFNRFEAKDFGRARHMAKVFPGSVICFCSFNDTLNADEIEGIKKIAQEGRERLGNGKKMNPVLVLTGLELFGQFSIGEFYSNQNSSEGGKVHGYLLTAESELDRVSHIARQTLGFYRDTGAPTDVYLHELLENVLTVYNSKLLTSGITTDTQFNDLRTVRVRKGELLQIFSNIVANAADAMRQGGRLEISTRQVVNSTRQGIQTVIKDNGAGIPQEHLARIFEPFFTTKGDLGTGIGLWVAKRLIDMCGGEISVASNTENGSSGTTVEIFIPYTIPLG